MGFDTNILHLISMLSVYAQRIFGSKYVAEALGTHKHIQLYPHIVDLLVCSREA